MKSSYHHPTILLFYTVFLALTLLLSGCGKDSPRNHAKEIDIEGKAYIAYPKDMVPQSLKPADQSRPAWMTILNIETKFQAVWVLIGFLGQMAYFGRMGLQWLISEKRGESTVPPVFWWLSLTGASMLLLYGIWRHDIIIILGQAFGWIVYTRNLMLLKKTGARLSTVLADPSPEPDLDTKIRHKT